jgi:hypothetical protein
MNAQDWTNTDSAGHSPGDPGREQEILRVEELLLDRATVGLSPEGEAELHVLLERYGLPLDESYERVAAVLDLALGGGAAVHAGAMPSELRARLREAGHQWAEVRRGDGLGGAERVGLPSVLSDRAARPGASVTGAAGSAGGGGGWGGGGRRHAPGRTVPGLSGSALWAGLRTWGGWAAAACLLVVVLWRPSMVRDEPSGPGDRSASATIAIGSGALAGVGEALASPWAKLISQRADPSTDLRVMPLGHTDTALPLGEVHWSPTRQSGFVRVSNLPELDRRTEQFQIWIRDATRDDVEAISGGVFDGPERGGEVLIPFSASLPVGRAEGFVVTVERRGGVPVPSGGRVVALTLPGRTAAIIPEAGDLPGVQQAEVVETDEAGPRRVPASGGRPPRGPVGGDRPF